MSINMEQAAIGLGVYIGLSRCGYTPAQLEKVSHALPQVPAMLGAIKEAQRLYAAYPEAYAWLSAWAAMPETKTASAQRRVADLLAGMPESMRRLLVNSDGELPADLVDAALGSSRDRALQGRLADILGRDPLPGGRYADPSLPRYPSPRYTDSRAQFYEGVGGVAPKAPERYSSIDERARRYARTAREDMWHESYRAPEAQDRRAASHRAWAEAEARKRGDYE